MYICICWSVWFQRQYDTAVIFVCCIHSSAAKRYIYAKYILHKHLNWHVSAHYIYILMHLNMYRCNKNVSLKQVARGHYSQLFKVCAPVDVCARKFVNMCVLLLVCVCIMGLPALDTKQHRINLHLRWHRLSGQTNRQKHLQTYIYNSIYTYTHYSHKYIVYISYICAECVHFAIYTQLQDNKLQVSWNKYSIQNVRL